MGLVGDPCMGIVDRFAGRVRLVPDEVGRTGHDERNLVVVAHDVHVGVRGIREEPVNTVAGVDNSNWNDLAGESALPPHLDNEAKKRLCHESGEVCAGACVGLSANHREDIIGFYRYRPRMS